MPKVCAESGRRSPARRRPALIWALSLLVLGAAGARGFPIEPGVSGIDRQRDLPLFSESDRRGILASLEPRGLGKPGDESTSATQRVNPIRRLGVDLVALVRAPAHFDRRDWGRFALATAAVAGVAVLDERIRDQVRTEDGSGASFASELRPLGQGAGLGLMALAWGWGEVAHRPRLAAIGQDGLEATIFAAGIVTPALKRIVGRARPREELGSRTFDGSKSFPSGETTQAFALAAVISAHSSSRAVDTLAWSTATLIGWERMRLDAHWASDVLAGALIGASIGRWVVRRHRSEALAEPELSWSPLVDGGSYGLSFRWRF